MRPNFQERKKKVAAKTNFGWFVSLKIKWLLTQLWQTKRQA